MLPLWKDYDELISRNLWGEPDGQNNTETPAKMLKFFIDNAPALFPCGYVVGLETPDKIEPPGALEAGLTALSRGKGYEVVLEYDEETGVDVYGAGSGVVKQGPGEVGVRHGGGVHGQHTREVVVLDDDQHDGQPVEVPPEARGAHTGAAQDGVPRAGPPRTGPPRAAHNTARTGSPVRAFPPVFDVEDGVVQAMQGVVVVAGHHHSVGPSQGAGVSQGAKGGDSPVRAFPSMDMFDLEVVTVVGGGGTPPQGVLPSQRTNPEHQQREVVVLDDDGVVAMEITPPVGPLVGQRRAREGKGSEEPPIRPSPPMRDVIVLD